MSTKICQTTSQGSTQINTSSCGQQAGNSTLTRNTDIAYPGTVIVAYYHSDQLAQCSSGCSNGSTSSSGPSGSDMDPSASAVIKADTRGAEQFDVLQGIPSSEYLYANAFGKNYLYNYQFNLIQGSKSYPVTVSKTYTLTWTQTTTNPDGSTSTQNESSSQTVEQQYMIQRDYSYYEINDLEVYSLQQATVQNYALPNSSVTLTPNGYTPPSLTDYHSTDDSYHIVDPTYQKSITLPGETIDGGSSPPSVPSENWQSNADAAVPQIQVRNDQVVFNGSTIMSNALTQKNGPVPSSIPDSTQIGQNVLYQSHLQIDPTKANQQSAPSNGTIYYQQLPQNIGGQASQNYPIPNINPVTVHTPVVDYSTVSDDKAHNQKTVPTAGRDAVILGRPFTVTMPTNGQHRSIPGYGNRDYAKYTKSKQVYFPFDVFSGDKSTFIPKNTWVDIPVNQETTTFYLPVWVDEGNYDVLFREIAINSSNQGFGTQPNANLDLNNYAATQDVPVEVIGRVYDFHVTDIADYNWQSIFRQSDGTTPTYYSYWVGDKDIDGNPRGNTPPYMLPVGQGSNPTQGYQNVAVKTGYHFKFDLKTIGNMFGPNDGIRITPSFYFVSANGGTPQPVDLYYHTQNNAFVQIGSAQDTEKRYVILNTPLRDVPQQELTDTSTYDYDQNSGGLSQTDFYNNYILSTQKQTWVGNYDLMILTQPLRTFIGNKTVPSGVDVERANASVQKWYGEYSLPAAPYVVPAGTDLAAYASTHTLDDNSSVFLENQQKGYIVINFNIETIQNQDVDHPHLQYKNGPLDNQWQMEGYKNTFTDPYGHTFNMRDGDVMMYDANQSSRDDFGSGQTH